MVAIACYRPPSSVLEGKVQGSWWPVQDAVPFALPEEEWQQGSETIELFGTFAWLKPPRGGPPSPNRREPGSGRAQVAEFEFDFSIHDLVGRQVLENLRAWYRPNAGSTRGEQLAQALATFAKEALSAFASGRLMPDDKNKLLPEAKRLLIEMTKQGFIQILRGDLNIIFDAFVYDPSSRYWTPQQLHWWAGSMVQLIKFVLENSSPSEQESWKDNARRQLADEDSEYYTRVDVRAWPQLRNLVDGTDTQLHGGALCRRIRVQLCAHGSGPFEKLADLEQAAKLLKELQLYRDFNPEGSTDHEIYQTFGDRSLNLEKRTELMEQVLMDAPRRLVREVLRKMDEDLDETERYEDREHRMLQKLLYNLDEDIRICKKAYLKLMRTWVRNVVEHEELTPDQICEHIEGDGQEEDNYELLLKDAVNYLHKENRTFEAAKMLARPKGQTSRVRESLRNDQQIYYLANLYKAVQETEDHFGPVAEGTMALPSPSQETYRVRRLPGKGVSRAQDDEGYHELQRLLEPTPRAIGLWWLWRCFDGYHDKHARAALVVITVEDCFFLVDILELERKTMLNTSAPLDKPYLELIKQICEARHLLKVVHYLEGTALRALQLALISEQQRHGDEKPSNYSSLSPCIDMALVAAYLSGTSAGKCKELPGLVWKYLRQDLCVTEALSNFEHRPLRESQEHYALCLAWCPLVILRACCSYQLVPMDVITDLTIKADAEWVKKRMDEVMYRENFGEGSSFPAAAGLEEPEAASCNIWEVPYVEEDVHFTSDWRSQLGTKIRDHRSAKIWSCRGHEIHVFQRQEPEPEDFPLKVCFSEESQAQKKLKLDESASQASQEAKNRLAQKLQPYRPPRWQMDCKSIVETLFNEEMAEKELKVLYERQASYRPPWRSSIPERGSEV